MRIGLAGLVIAASFVLGSPWGAARPGTGETPARGAPLASTLGVQEIPASASDSPDRLRYWVNEMRRRWKAERADGKARARTIRRLRRTLTVRAWRPTIEGVWLALASCESGRRWAYNGPSGFDGGLQFHPGTWKAHRKPWEPAYAYEAPAYVQVDVARRVLAAQGWKAWPACSKKLGLR